MIPGSYELHLALERIEKILTTMSWVVGITSLVVIAYVVHAW